jgi:hypothetical protein
MAKKVTYTENQKKEFLELAQEVGISRAIRELQYPSFRMAKIWAKQYGIEISLNELSQYANDMKQLYGDEEKLYTGQLALDRITERLNAGEELEGDELKKLSEAYKNTLTAMNLAQGKATAINESRTQDLFDAEMQSLIKEQEALNKIKEREANETN